MESRLEEREIVLGIDLRAVDDHFKMQVWSGRTAGGTDLADLLAWHHEIAGLHEYLRRMSVARHHAGAVLDIDCIAIAAVRSRLDHAAAGTRIDGRSGRRDEIHAWMKTQMLVEWIDAIAERRAKACARRGLPAGKRHVGGVVREP